MSDVVGRAAPDPPICKPKKPLRAITIGYVGRLGGWFTLGETMRFIRVEEDVPCGVRFHIWTQSDPELAKPYIAKGRRGMNHNRRG